MNWRTKAVVLPLVLAACHRATPEVTIASMRDDASNVTVSAGGSTISVYGGGVSGALGAVAALSPAELGAIELYPGAAVKSDTSVTAAGKNGASAIVSFETPDKPAAVIAFYRTAAARAGYHIEGELEVGGMALLSGKRSDGGAFQLSVSRSGDSSAATLIAAAKG